MRKKQVLSAKKVSENVCVSFSYNQVVKEYIYKVQFLQHCDNLNWEQLYPFKYVIALTTPTTFWWSDLLFFFSFL